MLRILLFCCTIFALAGLPAHAQAPEDYIVQGVWVTAVGTMPQWDSLPRAGVRFAYIRANVGGRLADAHFAAAVAAARAAGLWVGPCFQLRITEPLPPQLALFAQQCVGKEFALPPALLLLDAEGQSVTRTQRYVSQAIEALQAQTGHPPVLAVQWEILNSHLNGTGAECPLWVIDLNPVQPRIPEPYSDWALWLYTEYGTLPGLAGTAYRICGPGTWARFQLDLVR